ncbi:MAG: carbamoyl-phosphate synthase subunit L [Candidatus Wallbacteria bacterium HGW-Wallbacteria-1]|jgi:carbamoyl-phosphate synthase large subunit|uniref:Carbamoyl-phosphate synthase subunit L n=1 Tax=Candidatus Wallbacteria bacterium HGW-Wallbacteria-1 TaxID=2013854 RepID=A0A2N1PN13_9BACT|nr:MAG: carbamoyl-phosphate synthase subunit L [Candidatus Wallbacteria bacterium HGW-Wallbacteria-1]
MRVAENSIISVLVTGVGAIIGQGIIKGLRNSHYSVRIIGIDRSDRSPGPFLCDSFIKKPFCDESSSEYLKFWENLFQREKIDLIIPGLGSDVIFFDLNRSFFNNNSVPVVLNSSELISLGSDKWQLIKTLRKEGISEIPSILPNTWNDALEVLGSPPFLLKPRKGEGSRGIVRLYDEEDFKYWTAKTAGSCMLQRIMGNDQEEYTVGTFGFGNGEAIKPMIFRRKLSGAGNTLEAEVVQDFIVEQATVLLIKIFKPIGPTNFQFRKEDECAFLLEINPRFSSSNSLRSAFGYNETEMSIDYYLFDRYPSIPEIRHGIAWRYSEDFVIHDSDFI